MTDPSMDFLPGHEKRKFESEKKYISQAEMERRLKKAKERRESREKKVENASEFADIAFALESEPKARESAKKSIQEAFREKGIDAVIDGKVDKQAKSALEKGQFDVMVTEVDHQPRLAVKPSSGEQSGSLDAPSGNVAEKLPVKPSFQESFVKSFGMKGK